MRYRNIVLDKTVVLEGKLKQLEMIVQRQQPVSDFMKVISDAKELIDDIQGYVDREERTPGEINTGINR
jgi:hypothetical protein